MENKKQKLISQEYYERRPNITIRADLPKKILKFIKNLKKINQGSKWINEAIKEKYERDKSLL